MTRLPLPGLRGLPGLARLVVERLAALAALVVLAACGPSFQALYEGDVHFEHCYATDQKNVSPEVKKECWRDWLRGYTYGQSNDRVEYAATRFSLLSLDPTLPSEEDAGSRPRRPDHTVASPVPTSAFAPPPIVNAVDRERSDASAPAPERHAARPSPPPTPPPIAPGTECVGACEEHWSSCRGACKDGACEACDRTYRTCVPACFHEEGGAPRGR